jgi:hypothetical protein
MRGLITWPMVLLLSIRRRVLLTLLNMAREQTLDARNLVCASCSQVDAQCDRPQHCRIEPLKDREALLVNAIATIEERVTMLAGA